MCSQPQRYRELREIYRRNRKRVENDTILHKAAKYGDKERLEVWCDAHLSTANSERELLYTCNARGQTILHSAFWCGEHHFISYLLQWLSQNRKIIESNIVDDQGLSILHILCSKGHATLVIRLLEHCPGAAPVNAALARAPSNNEYWSEYSPLDFAVDFAQPTVVEILLEKGAIPRRTLLHAACRQTNVDVEGWVRLMVPLATDEQRRDPLNDVAGEADYVMKLLRQMLVNRRNVVKILCERTELDVNERDRCDETPLTYAINSNYYTLRRIFYDCGVDCRQHSLSMLTCDFATAQKTLIECLLEAGAIVDSRAYDLAMGLVMDEGDHELLEWFLDFGCDPNSGLSDGAPTRLHGVVDAFVGEEQPAPGNKLVEALVNHGANVNAVDADLSTTLHVAVQRGHFPTIVELLENVDLMSDMSRRTDVNAQDVFGNTALHYACMKSSGNGVDEWRLFELLLETGADFTILNNDGLSPLSFVYFSYFPESPDYIDVLENSACYPKTSQRLGCDVDSLEYRSPHYEFCAKALALSGSYSFCLNCFAENYLKYQMADCPVSEQCQAYVEDLDDNFGLFETPGMFERNAELIYLTGQYGDEVERMKMISIDCCHTLHSLLVDPTDKIAKYADNEKLKDMLESSLLEDEFQWYCELLRAKFVSGLRRRTLLNQAKESFDIAVAPINVPDLCVDKILGFLDNTSLNRLAEAFNGDEKPKSVKRKMQQDDLGEAVSVKKQKVEEEKSDGDASCSSCKSSKRKRDSDDQLDNHVEVKRKKE